MATWGSSCLDYYTYAHFCGPCGAVKSCGPLATLVLNCGFRVFNKGCKISWTPAPSLPPATSADTKTATKEGAKKNKKEGAKEASKQDAEQQDEEVTTVGEETKEKKQEENEEQGKEEGITDAGGSLDTAEAHESKTEVSSKEPAQRTPSEEEESATAPAPTEENI